MDITKKVMDKIKEIIEIDGFYITSKGDLSVGINDAEWVLSQKFYFDNQKDFEGFKELLYQMFENYVGVIEIETFNERRDRVEKEEREEYQQHEMRYLITDKGYRNSWKEANSVASYSNNVGKGIHFEIPHWMINNRDSSTEIIKSSDPEFRKILLEAAGRLENSIKNDEYTLSRAKTNLALINKELKYGK